MFETTCSLKPLDVAIGEGPEAGRRPAAIHGRKQPPPSCLRLGAMIRRFHMAYSCAATSTAGFIQMLACNYLPHGYWFYVSGTIPPDKDPALVDRKLIEKYQIDVSRTTRWRRKELGRANHHYLRFEDRFLLLSTHGKSVFFCDAKDGGESRRDPDGREVRIRDVRKSKSGGCQPILFAGYSLSCVRVTEKGRGERYRVRVQVCREMFLEWKAYLVAQARIASRERMEREFKRFPYQPYRPVRQQLYRILEEVNGVLGSRGLAKLSLDVIPNRRKIVRPFDPDDSDWKFDAAA